MKINSMRVATFLLALTLITSCFVGGTFAKYITTGPAATDSARVANWGVEITGTGVMFNDSYLDEFTTYTANETTNDITVQANAPGTDVIAPGTEGNLAALSVTGTPEVDVQVTYVADLALANWMVDVTDDSTDNAVYYCPLIITVGTQEFDGTEYDSAAEFEAAVEAAIVAKGARYHTNTNLNAVNDDVVVSWRWAFDANDEPAAEQDDTKDTALGDAATKATVALTITATITQID